MHIAHGIDLVDFGRIEQMLDRHGRRFLERVFTVREQSDAEAVKNRIEKLAGRFAAKEAISKALGTGIRGIQWREMEVISDPQGKPLVQLHGEATNRAKELGITSWAISLSHSQDYAVAFVIADQTQAQKIGDEL
jgi:holo-[acyl-carrier protein] synthase